MASSETQTDCLTRSPELPRPCKERKSGAPPYAVVDSQRMPEAGPPSRGTPVCCGGLTTHAGGRAQAANVTVLHVGRARLESPDPCGSERPVAKLAVRGRYLDGVEVYPFSGSATNLYPTPRTVSRWRGFAGSSSI